MSLDELKLRVAERADVSILFDLIKALAEYENLSHAVTGNVASLEAHLFVEPDSDRSNYRPMAEAIIAELTGKPVGFSLFFYNYSTFLTQPGIYIEDLFVLPEYRGRGIGKRLISYLAQLAVSQNCGRLEWSVLDWNKPAIGFYEHMGASILDEWRICRVTDNALGKLASQQEL
ncbi:MAG: GNAT family N-acetyltransferase [Trichodesmium sp. St16_bin4-tuft]|nr:GNAT family N-acetyltransferase [Trichodesmium sp. St4_bin8_1]MDE5073949.1 GNAT family N-acetyltransferase [Trichodesmium sp. St5_bin8]MDE5077748.1 GNAT family N-acetyltransferase [Trichodesmium sp. St2_bin6]MDE5090432.1 GNAT family N-acetyltransferase [Trichodesmium sp. St18_bin3_1_1]MDE5099537.1 GNAT family N-acetyltransferase [Trichodesmium sp. St16_bin4-tuft]MDE5104016.1 GNAT family N-acetyltransferase [Trichodesmium sp. St19_bin2]